MSMINAGDIEGWKRYYFLDGMLDKKSASFQGRGNNSPPLKEDLTLLLRKRLRDKRCHLGAGHVLRRPVGPVCIPRRYPLVVHLLDVLE